MDILRAIETLGGNSCCGEGGWKTDFGCREEGGGDKKWISDVHEGADVNIHKFVFICEFSLLFWKAF